MKRRLGTILFLVALAAILTLVVTGCSSGGSTQGTTPTPAPSAGTSSGAAPGGGTTITEQSFAFNPADVTVRVGDTVTFTNNDSATHNVKIDGQELGVQNQGESKTWKATKAGTFPYICTLHPNMTGQIKVE